MPYSVISCHIMSHHIMSSHIISFPLQSKDPPQVQCFHLFPKPKSQQHPIQLLQSFLPTAAQGPTPNSVFLFVSPTPKSTTPNTITPQLPPHLSPRTHLKLSVVFICFLNTKANNTKYHYSTASSPPQSKDPPQIQSFYLFPQANSQRHPIPLLHSLLFYSMILYHVISSCIIVYRVVK